MLPLWRTVRLAPSRSTSDHRLLLSLRDARRLLRTTVRLLGLLGLLLFLFLLKDARRHWRDFLYLIRPLWDTPDKPWVVLPHYAVDPLWIAGDPNATARLCGLHGWHVLQPPQAARRKVYDAVMVSVEIDLLEVRIRELWDVVDRFIIMESDRTFTGLSKPLEFAQARKDRFSFAESKLQYIPFHNLDARPRSPWINEARMRTEIGQVLHERAGVTEGDLVLQMDLDEIPSTETVRLLKACAGYPSELHLQMQSYMYSFEFPVPGSYQWRAKVLTAGPQGVYYNHLRAGDTMLAAAGWHCSWCFRHIQHFQFKMQAYSHSDSLISSPKNLDPKHIQASICSGHDVLRMYPETYTYFDMWQQWRPLHPSTDLTRVPRALVEDAHKFAFLLPGGCRRP